MVGRNVTILRLPPCELDEEEPDCLTCEDSGEATLPGSDVLMPCPDCPAYDLKHSDGIGFADPAEELLDDMRRGK